MGMALDEARRALGTGDVPVGALVLDESGRVIGVGHNEREATGDPTAHADQIAKEHHCPEPQQAEQLG